MKLWDVWRGGAPALKRKLRFVAAVEPSADLWTRIQSETRAGSIQSPASSGPPHARRRFAPLLAMVLIVIGGAGTVAAKQGWLSWRAPIERQMGPFLVSGYFYGRMEYYDAAGNLKQIEDTSEDKPVRGGRATVRVVDGNGASDLTLSAANGNEEYVTHDVAGNPRAKLVLRRQPEDISQNPWMTHPPQTFPQAQRFLEEAWQWQVNLWRSGSVGVDETPLGVSGYDCSRGLVWSVRGTARASVQPVGPEPDVTLQGQHGETSTGFGPPLSTALAAHERRHPQPEMNVTYQGDTLRAAGYGTHELRDQNGNLVLTVTIEPLD